jgi:N-acetylneuraminate synthase
MKQWEMASRLPGDPHLRFFAGDVRDQKTGVTMGANYVRSVRPCFGLPPKRFDDVLGCTVKRNVTAYAPARDEDLGPR